MNRWCSGCEALIVAGTLLGGACGHDRLFPPGFVWAPNSWCWECVGLRDFGAEPVVAVVAPRVPTFWLGEFRTTATSDRRQPARPLSLHELGRALAWPTVAGLHRRLGVVHRRSWYRWRESGLSWDLADRLAVNANLHPIEVWGPEWASA